MNNGKVLERIRKLLAMAGDTSSPNEAAIAAGRARYMMDKYQVSELDLTALEPDQFGAELSDTGQKTMSKPFSVMAVAVARLNDCQVKACDSHGTTHMKFEGILADAVTATLIFSYLKGEMYKQAENNATGRANRYAYRLGFATGIAKQVRELQVERETIITDAGTALVTCKQQLVRKQFGAARYKQTRSSYSGSRDSFQNGRIAGERANLNRQVTGASQRAIT